MYLTLPVVILEALTSSWGSISNGFHYYKQFFLSFTQGPWTGRANTSNRSEREGNIGTVPCASNLLFDVMKHNTIQSIGFPQSAS